MKIESAYLALVAESLTTAAAQLKMDNDRADAGLPPIRNHTDSTGFGFPFPKSQVWEDNGWYFDKRRKL